MCVAHSQDTYSLCLLTVFNAAVNPRPSFLSSPRLFLFSPCKSNCGMLFTLKVWAKHPRGSRSWHPVLHRLGTAGGIAEVPSVLQYCSAFRPGVTLVQGLCRCTPVEHSYHCSLKKRKKKKEKLFLQKPKKLWFPSLKNNNKKRNGGIHICLIRYC